jgi:hypothetical protein
MATPPDAAPRIRGGWLRGTAALLTMLSLALAVSPGSLPALARLGLGGGVGVGGWGSGVGGYRFGGAVGIRGGYVGYHPVYGAGVRPAVRVGAVDGGFYDRPYVAFHPAWVNAGYWGARPWTAGWYRVNPAGWDWWGANAAAWGLTGLATSATITSLVNAAAAQQSAVIVVPQTTFQLNYGSVEAVGSSGASFFYSVDGGANQLFGGANCQQGLLDGQVPASAAEAQLLNTVCQVAYGSPA